MNPLPQYKLNRQQVHDQVVPCMIEEMQLQIEDGYKLTTSKLVHLLLAAAVWWRSIRQSCRNVTASVSGSWLLRRLYALLGCPVEGALQHLEAKINVGGESR